MTERFMPPFTATEEIGTPALSGTIELRPPGGKQVLFFNAEAFLTSRSNHIHSVPDSNGDIMTQWTAMAHGMRLDDMHTVPVYETSTQIPDISRPDIARRFAGIIGTGAAAMVTDHHAWTERYMEVLRTLPDAQIPALLTCFSMQAFAESVSGRVKVNDSGKRKFGVGRYELTSAGREHWAFQGLDNSFLAYRSHFQDVDPFSLPPDVDILVADAEDGSVAAIAFGEVAAIQFHNDLSVAAMEGLSQTRIEELLTAGMTQQEFIQGLRNAELEVMGTNRTINANFNQRMHDRHQLVSR